MKAFMNLVLNEIIKMWKQTGYRVIIFVMMGLALLTPLMNLLLSGNFLSFTAEDEYESYLDWVEKAETEIEEEYYETCAKAYKFFIDNDIADGWQYRTYINEYVNACLEERAYRLIADEKYSADEVKGNFYIDLEDKEDADGLYEEAKQRRIDIETRVLASENEFMPMAVEDKKDEIELIRDQLEGSKSNGGTERDIILLEISLEAAEAELECLEIAEEREKGPNSWEYCLVSEKMYEYVLMMQSCVPISENEYEKNYSGAFSQSYDSYVKECDKKLEYYDKEFDKCVYAVKNNIDIYNKNVDTETRSSMDSVVQDIGIVMIILVATMIAGEFSRGTVRLLFIRPRSRTQIIASKLIAATVIFVAITVACLVLVSVENLIIHGFGSFMIPVYIGNTIVKLPSFILTFGSILVAMLTVFADMAVAAIFATLTKKTGTAIVLPLVIKFAVSSLINGIGIVLMELLPNAFGWLAYSPVPYINMTVTSLNNPMFSSTFWRLNIWIGIAYHIIFIAVLIWLSVLRFKKTQVKG